MVALLVDAVLSGLGSGAPALDPSAATGYSTVHARRVFADHMSESLGSFALRIRLERAAGELAETEKSVTTVAAESGYSTAEAFSCAFPSHFGMSPTDFRQRNRDPSRRLPGYLAATGTPRENLPREVGIVGAASALTTYVYDGLSYCGKILPERTDP